MESEAGFCDWLANAMKDTRIFLGSQSHQERRICYVNRESTGLSGR